MNSFQYLLPGTLSEASLVLADDAQSKCIAGGTNIIDLWKYNLVNPSVLVNVSRALGENEIRELNDGIVRLPAAVTNADTAYHPLIEQRYPLLSKAILAGASAQIRNMATNGGNLLQRTRCYYFYDADLPCNKRTPGSGCPAINGYNRIHAILGASDQCIAVFPSDMSVALAALGATINVSDGRTERVIAFNDFHRLPGSDPQLDNNLGRSELITSIDLPQKGFSKNYSYLKIRDRHSYAFALVSVATALKLDGNIIREARIVLGGVAHKPWRDTAAEAWLVGKPADAASFSHAADLILKEAKGYAHNGFKIALAKKAIVRNGLMALEPAKQRAGAQPSL